MAITTDDVLTETRYLKRSFGSQEKDEFLRQMFSAQDGIEEKDAELRAFQATNKSEVARLEANIGILKNKLRTGYEQIPVQCVIKYDGGNAKYYNKATGEFVDERAMTEQEQLRLAGGLIDAEAIIRADEQKQEQEETDKTVKPKRKAKKDEQG